MREPRMSDHDAIQLSSSCTRPVPDSHALRACSPGRTALGQRLLGSELRWASLALSGRQMGVETDRNGSEGEMTDLFVLFSLLACFEPKNASVQIDGSRVLCEAGLVTTETPVDGIILFEVRRITRA